MIRIRSASGDLPPFGRLVLLGVVAVGLVFAVALFVANGVRSPFGDDSYVVEARFADAGGLTGSDRTKVTIAGVQAGRVAGLRHEGDDAVVRLRLQADTRGKLHEGARALVRPRSQLGDQVVELSPGRHGAPAIVGGATIPASSTSATVPLDRVLDTLDTDTRAYLQVILAGLDAGVGGPRGDDLSRALRRLDPFTSATKTVAASLARRRVLVSRLVGHLDVLLNALGERGDDLRGTISSARRVLATADARSGEIGATVRALPATLDRVRGAVADAQRAGDHLDPALDALEPVARDLPAALRATRTSLPEVDRLLAAVRRTGRVAGPGAAAARTTADALARTAGPLESPVRRADPVVAAIDRNKTGIGLLGERFSGVFSTNDANGPVLRGLGFFEPFDPANFGFGNARGARKRDAAKETAQALTNICLRDNPLACLVRYLVPGLPGAERTARDRWGQVGTPSRARSGRLLAAPPAPTDGSTR